MFIGRYYHTIDEKGRIIISKHLRAQSKAEDWIVTRGLDGGLFLFSPTTFEAKLAELASSTLTRKRDRDFVRYLTNDAFNVNCDSQGRVLLPEYLRQFANLQKQVVIVGSYTYIEIWDQDRYHQYLDALESNGEALAESIYETSVSST